MALTSHSKKRCLTSWRGVRAYNRMHSVREGPHSAEGALAE